MKPQMAGLLSYKPKPSDHKAGLHSYPNRIRMEPSSVHKPTIKKPRNESDSLRG